jgi:hypothetical protein
MRSGTGRALLGAALLIAAVVLFLVLQDDGGDGTADSGGGTDAPARTESKSGDAQDKPAKPAKSSIPVIEIENGKPVGGVAELGFAAGDRIQFEVDSDVADEVHVHGYDVSKGVEAGGSVRFDFPATIEGVFEVELEGRVEPIAELRVTP